MISETQQRIIDTLVNKLIQNDREKIEEMMKMGTDSLPLPEAYPQMARNAITLSVQLSVNIVASLLKGLGLELVPDDEKTLQRLNLSVVSHPEQDDRD